MNGGKSKLNSISSLLWTWATSVMDSLWWICYVLRPIQWCHRRRQSAVVVHCSGKSSRVRHSSIFRNLCPMLSSDYAVHRRRSVLVCWAHFADNLVATWQYLRSLCLRTLLNHRRSQSSRWNFDGFYRDLHWAHWVCWLLCQCARFEDVLFEKASKIYSGIKLLCFRGKNLNLRSPHVEKMLPIRCKAHNANATPVTSFLANAPHMAVLKCNRIVHNDEKNGC